MNKFILNENEDKEKKAENSEALTEKFLKTRQIILSGEVNKELAAKIVRELFILEADDSEKPIYIYIDSPGGDVDSGFAIFDAIRFVSCPVYIIGIGLIASAAALILLSVPKENRFGFEYSRYLIHQPLSEMRGVATDVEIYAKEMENTRAVINQIISEQTGQSLQKVTQDTERDYWLGAKEAIEYGLISKIVKNRSDLK